MTTDIHLDSSMRTIMGEFEPESVDMDESKLISLRNARRLINLFGYPKRVDIYRSRTVVFTWGSCDHKHSVTKMGLDNQFCHVAFSFHSYYDGPPSCSNEDPLWDILALLGFLAMSLVRFSLPVFPASYIWHPYEFKYVRDKSGDEQPT